MLRRLIKIANNLDLLGMHREAEKATDNLKKLKKRLIWINLWKKLEWMKQILWKEKEIEKRILNLKIIYWSSIEF